MPKKTTAAKSSTKATKAAKTTKANVAAKATSAPKDSGITKAYEVMLILQPNLRESDVKKKLKEFDEFLASGKAEITHLDILGKDELAYKIKGHKEGIYVVYNLSAPTSFTHEINQHLRIDKDVIRYIVIALPSGYTYTKFDTTPEPKEEKVVRKPKMTEKTTKAPAAEEAPESGKAPDQSQLDEKLDEILGGDL